MTFHKLLKNICLVQALVQITTLYAQDTSNTCTESETDGIIDAVQNTKDYDACLEESDGGILSNVFETQAISQSCGKSEACRNLFPELAIELSAEVCVLGNDTVSTNDLFRSLAEVCEAADIVDEPSEDSSVASKKIKTKITSPIGGSKNNASKGYMTVIGLTVSLCVIGWSMLV